MHDRPERLEVSPGPFFAPPFTLDDVGTHLFVVEADRARLDALLARTFGWAAPALTVRALGPWVLVVFTDMGRARCADPQLGWERYRELSVFVPVHGTRDGEAFTAVHVPFIYPDSARAMASGREHYGLPKKHAHAISLAPPTLTLDVMGADRLDGGEWTPRRLLTATLGACTSVPHPHDQPFTELLAQGLDRTLASLPALLGLSVLQLHQTADLDPGRWPRRVRERSVVCAPCRVRSLRDVERIDTDDVTLTVGDPATDPLCTALGLAATTRPIVAARFTMDFTLDPAERWNALPDGVPAPRRERVVVLGGGMAGLTAALALTSTEDRRRRFDVRVLVQGHRLGGKGASWRSDDANARIEEHGIHVIFGFYHNFLRVMREVYAEAGRSAPIVPASFEEAFEGRRDLAFHDGTHTERVELGPTPVGWGTRSPTIPELLTALKGATGTLLARIGSVLKGLRDLLLPAGPPSLDAQLTEFAEVLARGVGVIALDLTKSFDDYDDVDFRDWLRAHGASEGLLSGAVVQVPYDAVFAYALGDTRRPTLAAGMAIRCLLHLAFFYEESLYFIMRAGMGEAVFAPIYEVLRRRGVAIEFFSRVTSLTMEASVATEITVERQAIVRAGRTEYAPLTVIRDTPCWSKHPDTTQLSAVIEGELYADANTASVGRETLRVGADFDRVVCAMPAPVTARALVGIDNNPWLSGIREIPTVATVHLQTWHAQPLDALGWTPGARAVGGFAQPFNTLLDAGAVLSREGWASPRPQGLLYACGPLDDAQAHDAPALAARFVAAHYAAVLPDEKTPLRTSFLRVNTDRAERYVLCVPGGLKHRPRPSDEGHPNLTLAGDWTRTGIDIPCMEGAVVSGLRAAEAISGEDFEVIGTRDAI